MKHVALKVYEQVKNGDSITTDDLIEAMNFFKSLSDDLMKLGPVFRLAFIEANETYMILSGYFSARVNAVC